MRIFIISILFIVNVLPLNLSSQTINLSQNTTNSINPLIMDFNNDKIVFWQDDLNGDYDIYFKYKAGNSWSTIQNINTPYNSHILSTSIFEQDSIFLLWRKNTGNSNSIVMGKIYNYSLIDTVELIQHNFSTIESADIYYDSNNKSVNLCWNSLTSDSSKIYYSYRDSNNVWHSPLLLHSQSRFAEKLKLRKDKVGNLYCFWVNGDSAIVAYKYKNSGSIWSQLEIINNDGIYNYFDYDAEIDDSLNIHVVMQEHSLTTLINSFLYTKWDGLNWSPLEYIPFTKRAPTIYRMYYHPEIDFSDNNYCVVSCDQINYTVHLQPYAYCISSSVKLDSGWHTNRNIAEYHQSFSTKIVVDDNDNINFVWIDSTDGDFDVYYKSTDLITKIYDSKNAYIYSYNLMQNYPNPFNPNTTIKFEIPKQENVKIEIFNLLGQKIQTLLNKKMSSGLHEIKFSAQNLSSGIYLYKIEAGEFKQMRKMIYLK